MKAIAFDGEFFELAVDDENGRALTVLRFMKKFWEKVQKILKCDKMSFLLGLRNEVIIRPPQNIAKAIYRKQKRIVASQRETSISKAENNDNFLLQDLPEEILNALDRLNTIASTQQACRINSDTQPEIIPDEEANNESQNTNNSSPDYEAALITLIAINVEKKHSIWRGLSLDYH